MGGKLYGISEKLPKLDAKSLLELEEEQMDKLTERMRRQAEFLRAEPRKLLSHALDYRFYVENGEIRKETP